MVVGLVPVPMVDYFPSRERSVEHRSGDDSVDVGSTPQHIAVGMNARLSAFGPDLGAQLHARVDESPVNTAAETPESFGQPLATPPVTVECNHLCDLLGGEHKLLARPGTHHAAFRPFGFTGARDKDERGDACSEASFFRRLAETDRRPVWRFMCAAPLHRREATTAP